MLLKALCEANGVSGNEGAVRKLILEQITPLADDIKIDSIGNILAMKKGRSSAKKIMLAAHMDEVGLIISGITEKGFLEFKTVGGIDTRVLISKRVAVGEKRVKGVIGIKAIHLQEKSERETVPKVKNLFIDIGAKDREEAEGLVRLGDYAAFDTEFAEFGAGKIKAKAIDDRAGCLVLMDLMNQMCRYDTYFCFTVQEEVGLRGAQVAARRIMPDIALVLEATTCSDVFGSQPHEYVTQLGGGVAVSFMDRSTIVPHTFYSWLYETAQREGIPVQYKNTTMGGNDAGAIHIAGRGVKTASLSIPCRYLHSPAGVAAWADLDAMEALAKLFMERIDEVI